MDRTDENKYQIQNEGSIYGQIIGEGNQITQIFYNPGDASARSTLQQRVWNIPYPPNPYFTGREELLSRLEAMLQTRQPAALSQPQAISGLGGIGKTQIALAYAYQHKQDYQTILWSRADTTEALISGFVAFAELLQLPQKDDKDQLAIVEAAKNWLRTHNQWLLILDNADELAIVREFLPLAGQGHTLLTTRAASTGGLANRIEVEILDQDVGALFVLRRAGILAADAFLDQAKLDDVSLARELVREMGGLPLALDQAGAYIEEVQGNLSDYLKRYRQYRVDLLKERGGLVVDHPEPITTTWSLSFEKIEQNNPAAADLLRVCAFLQPDAIPEEILLEGAPHLGQEVQQLPTNPLGFDQALKALLSYSLIQRNPAERLLSVHRLVQAVLKDMMDVPTYRLWTERTVQAVKEVLPNMDHTTRERYERCLPHAQGCAVLIEQLHLTSSVATQLLRQTAHYLYRHARYAEAESLYLQALHIRERTHGPEHSSVASMLYSLAGLYSKQGKFPEAELLFLRAWHIWEQAHGPEHPYVAYPLNSLAFLYREQGKYAEAEPLFQRALHIWKQAHGPEHPQVGDALYNLAILYKEQGKYVEAGPLYQRALHIWEQAHGPEHSSVAYALYCLANLYREQGKYAEAEPLYQRAWHIWEQNLGPEHPEVAYPLHGLALLYFKQGKYAEAEPLFQRALHIREQAYGPEYHEEAYPLHGLAELYREQGKYAEAEPLYQRSLHIREQTLGPLHPLVAYPLHGLAELYREQGKYAEAEPLYQRSLHIREQTLGPEYPEVAHPLHGLAELYREQGKYVEAEPLYQRSLHIWEQALGSEHPEVAYALYGLAELYREQGKYAEAEPLYQRSLHIWEQTLGPQHPLTQKTAKNYISLLHTMGRETEASCLQATFFS